MGPCLRRDDDAFAVSVSGTRFPPYLAAGEELAFSSPVGEGVRWRLTARAVILRCEPRLRRASKDAQESTLATLRGSLSLAPQGDGPH
ncbi:MAG: hypothetical protein BGP05_12445 [Rhizobiales bacterium 62-47]|nr:MAG: hypothetical protein BGP05_12445 [Rhizobiales bacterium 62-47]